ncbi:hypothetical protein DV738_g4643, partial [Chaetothyriales sp. CBS 135597]
MMPASTLKPTRSEQKREEALLHKKHTSRRVRRRTEISSLEKLPVEVIQQIFFLCLETNLPNASPILSKALSHESIYRAVILLAYFDYNEWLYIDTALFRPAEFVYLGYWERCWLQRRILNTRWCTLDRIKAAMPSLSRLAMVQACHDEWLAMRRECDRPPSLEPKDCDLLVPGPSLGAHHGRLPSISDTPAMNQHFFATSDVEFPRAAFDDLFPRPRGRPVAAAAYKGDVCGDENYLAHIHCWKCKRADLHHSTGDQLDEYDNPRMSKFPAGAQTTLGVRCIPAWLLCGPWSGPGADERLDFLKLLRQGQRFVKSGNILDISANALFEGIKSAILALLIRASAHSIPPDDSILTAWALRMRALGNPIGGWLLAYMEHTALTPHTWPLFTNGAYTYGFGTDDNDDNVFPQHGFEKDIDYCDDDDPLIIPIVITWAGETTETTETSNTTTNKVE